MNPFARGRSFAQTTLKAVFVGSIAVAAAWACSSDDVRKKGLAVGCALSSDCDSPLVCTFGLCHAACQSTADCPRGERCVISPKESVCQLEQEATCVYDSQCKDPLVCAVDRQCRNECQADRDCPAEQVCAETGVCADREEVNTDGRLRNAADSGAGGLGAGGAMGAGGAEAGGAPATGGAGAGGVPGAGGTLPDSGAGGTPSDGGAPGTGGIGAGGTGTGGAGTGGTGTGGTPATTATLTVQSGTGQSGYIAQALSPVTLRLVDGAGAPLQGHQVTLTPDRALGVGTSSTLTTNSLGRVTFLPRLGRRLGDYLVGATAPGAAPVQVTLTATAPPAGTILTLLNATGVTGYSNQPAPAASAPSGRIIAITTAPDGTIYFSDMDNCYVGAIDPDGVVTPVTLGRGGVGACSYGGDDGPPSAATFGAAGSLVHHAATNTLYFGGYYIGNDTVVRAIDFGLNRVYRYSGGGSLGGTGILGTDAFLEEAYLSSVAPDGTLYLVDYRRTSGSPRSVRVTPAGVLETSFPPLQVTNPACGTTAFIASLDYSPPMGHGFDSQGRQYIGVDLCGTSLAQSGEGIVRVDAGGAITHIAGGGTLTADGVAATQARLGFWRAAIAVQGNEIAYINSNGSGGVTVRRINLTSGTVTTVGGDGASPRSPPVADYQGAKTGEVYPDAPVVLLPGGHVVLSDNIGETGTIPGTIRMIWSPP